MLEDNKALQLEKDQLISGTQSKEDGDKNYIQELSANIKTCEDQINHKSREIEDLNNTINESKNNLDSIIKTHVEENSKKDLELTNLTSKLKQLQNENTNLNTANNDSKTKFEDLQQKYDEETKKLIVEFETLKKSQSENQVIVYSNFNIDAYYTVQD